MRIRHLNSERGDIEYIYDDDAIVDEVINGTKTQLAHYRYGDRLLSLSTNTGDQYYHYATLGTTANLTDSVGANQVAYRTDPFGEITKQEGESVNRQVFTGQEHDAKTGLIYFGARFYDPDTARFINQDTYLGESNTPPSLHRYLYAYSNPTVYVDPDGHAAVAMDDNALRNSAVNSKEGAFAEQFGLELTEDGRGRRKFKDNDAFIRHVYEAAEYADSPVIMLVEKGDTTKDLLGLAYETLGDRLTPQQRQELKAQIEAAKPGTIINMSGYMEGAAARTHRANDNFLSDFQRDLDQRTDDTSFLEDPSAHVTYAWTTIGESVGRSFETSVDSSAPQHIRHAARAEAVAEIATTAVPIGKAKHLRHARHAKKSQKDIVYRVIRADEDPLSGLAAKKPGRGMTVSGHVRTGSRNKGSQYISTTRSKAIAEKYAREDGLRYVEIDLSKVNSQVIDLSTDAAASKHISNPITKRFATSREEVLVVDEIPADAIINVNNKYNKGGG